MTIAKHIRLEQSGTTEREAIAAWTRAFRAERAILGGIQTTTMLVNRTWLAYATVAVTAAEHERIQKKRAALGHPLAQAWNEL